MEHTPTATSPPPLLYVWNASHLDDRLIGMTIHPYILTLPSPHPSLTPTPPLASHTRPTRLPLVRPRYPEYSHLNVPPSIDMHEA